MRLLVTRPEPDGERTAAVLRARGHAVTLSPVLVVRGVEDAGPGEGAWPAILLTSANAARSIARQPRFVALKQTPVLVVGQATAEAARAAGFARVESANGDAGDLAALAAARIGRGGRALYLAGADQARDLAGMLREADIQVTTLIVYRTEPADRLAPDVEAALRAGTIDAVLHFSRRSAAAFLACAAGLRDHALAPLHVCLSERTAAPLREAGAPRIVVAERPDEAALLASVAQQVV